MIDQSSWLTPIEALAILKPRYGENSKKVIVSRCERGLLDAFAAILVNTFYNITEMRWNVEYEREFEHEIPDSRFTDTILPSTFWSIGMADAPLEGHDDVSGFGKTVYADWEIGDFGFKQELKYDDAERWQRAEAAGVHFNRVQIELIAGSKAQDTTITPDSHRSRSKYDWEMAIAAFGGAQQKWDIVPDFYAHGAQAQIERWLSQWFELNGKFPAEPTIRPKAAMILREYQKADRQSPDVD